MRKYRNSAAIVVISMAMSACGFDGDQVPEIHESQPTIKENVGGKGQTSNNGNRVSQEIKENIGGNGQSSFDRERELSIREATGGHGQSSFDKERELSIREAIGGHGQSSFDKERERVHKESLGGKGEKISTGKPSSKMLDKWKRLDEFDQSKKFKTSYDVSSNLPIDNLELTQYKENDIINLGIGDVFTLLQDVNVGSIEGLFTSIGSTYIDDFSDIRIMTPNDQSGIGEISCKFDNISICDENPNFLTDVSFFDESITFAEEKRLVRVNGIMFEADDLSKNRLEYTLSVPNGEMEIFVDYLWSDKFGIVEVDAIINTSDKLHYDDGSVEYVNEKVYMYKADNAKFISFE